MPHITVDLIRRKAEHNEGLIHTLEEISLHQEELEAIAPVLGSNCRRIKILYLQNNIICKMENLHHLKELEYLNLALNNIAEIQGLGSCEFLKKLDLTVNFIDLDTLQHSIEHLQSRHLLQDLYLTGNPAQTKWAGFNNYVVGMLPQLERLDGKDIVRSTRIIAERQLPCLKAELCVLARECESEKRDKMAASAAAEPKADDEMTQHTPEARTQIYRELAEQKRETEERKRENLPKERDYDKEHADAVQATRDREGDGKIRQCNEGKLEYFFDEGRQKGVLVLDVAVPRFLDSSLIDLDVHPHYISIIIKGKVLRLSLPVEVKAGESSAQRSRTSGNLVISMPKVKPGEMVGLTMRSAGSKAQRPGGTEPKGLRPTESIAAAMMREAQTARKQSSAVPQQEAAPSSGSIS